MANNYLPYAAIRLCDKYLELQANALFEEPGALLIQAWGGERGVNKSLRYKYNQRHPIRTRDTVFLFRMYELEYVNTFLQDIGLETLVFSHRVPSRKKSKWVAYTHPAVAKLNWSPRKLFDATNAWGVAANAGTVVKRHDYYTLPAPKPAYAKKQHYF